MNDKLCIESKDIQVTIDKLLNPYLIVGIFQNNPKFPHWFEGYRAETFLHKLHIYPQVKGVVYGHY